MDWGLQDPWMLLATVIVGAMLMYLFNALTGPRRRTLLRDQLIQSIHQSRDALGTSWRSARSAIQSRRSRPSSLEGPK